MKSEKIQFFFKEVVHKTNGKLIMKHGHNTCNVVDPKAEKKDRNQNPKP